MAVNPYALADTMNVAQRAKDETRQQYGEAKEKLAIQKGKMTEQYEEEIANLQRQAEEELAKKYKPKKKGLGFLGGLLGMWNPIVGALVGAGVGMSESKRGAKHFLKQTELAKNIASNLDKRWGKTFLASGPGGSRDYLRGVDQTYGKLFTKAQEAEPDSFDLFKIGLTDAVKSYAMGKTLKGLGEGLGTARDIKKLQGEFLKEGMDFSEIAKDPSAIRGHLESGEMFSGKLGEMFSGESGDKILTKLAGAKRPVLKQLFENLGEVGTEGFFDDKGGSFLQGLLKVLALGGAR